MKKLKKIIKKIIFLNKNTENLEVSEEVYYENLFIKNEIWNNENPNKDELQRWKAIKKLIETQINPNLNSKVLDLGCGRGWLSNLLSNYGQVIGIEPVDNVVQYAKKLFPNIEFFTGTAETLLINKFHDKFDFIVSSEVFEHIVDDRKTEFVKNIHTLLKENGFVIITTPRKDIQEEWLKIVGANQPVEDWISEKDLEAIFNQNGFKTISLERVSIKLNESTPEMEIYQVWLFKK